MAKSKSSATNDMVSSLRKTGRVYSAKYTFPQIAAKFGVSSLETLFSILSLARPYGSRSCNEFVDDLHDMLHGMADNTMYVSKDKVGNIIVSVGKNENKILWSCHTDTIHPKHIGYAPLVYNNAYVCSQGQRQLGADDGVGVWIMLSMIKAKVDGLYIFHAGEEVGGVGSRHIARENPELLTGIKYAVAFDRKGTGSIITYQYEEMSCSDDFARSLANTLGLGHRCDDTGVFTDTANYMDIIPECTNVSAGYENEHTFSEYLCFTYARALRDALIAAHTEGKYDTLVCKRDPNVSVDKYSTYGYSYDDSDYSAFVNSYSDRRVSKTSTKHHKNDWNAMIDCIEAYPHTVASILSDFGIDADYIYNYSESYH